LLLSPTYGGGVLRSVSPSVRFGQILVRSRIREKIQVVFRARHEMRIGPQSQLRRGMSEDRLDPLDGSTALERPARKRMPGTMKVQGANLLGLVSLSAEPIERSREVALIPPLAHWRQKDVPRLLPRTQLLAKLIEHHAQGRGDGDLSRLATLRRRHVSTNQSSADTNSCKSDVVPSKY